MSHLERTFRFQTVSALFMHAATSETEAELRPPSIKGVMRYWFRALAGAYYPQAALAQYENQLFGVADEKVGSRLMVRINAPLASTRDKYLLPHKERENKGSLAKAILENREFEVVLRALAANSPQDAANRLAVASWSLWLAAHLGGFGQRARRGAGSLQLLSISPALPDASAPGKLYKSIDDLAAELSSGLAQARRVLPRTQPLQTGEFSQSGEAFFPILDKDCASIQVMELEKKIKTEQDARSSLMLDLRKHKNPAFGLPLKLADNFISGRHASPLHLHLHPLADGGFAVVQTVLFSKYDQRDKVDPDWRKMEDYLDESFKYGVKVTV